jgi:hypothetical protein
MPPLPFAAMRRRRKSTKVLSPEPIHLSKSSIQKNMICHLPPLFKDEEVYISSARSPPSPLKAELV